MGSKGEDAGNGSFGCSKDGVVCQFEPTLDESAIEVSQEGSCRVFGIWEGVYVDACIACGMLVGELCNCICMGL